MIVRTRLSYVDVRPVLTSVLLPAVLLAVAPVWGQDNAAKPQQQASGRDRAPKEKSKQLDKADAKADNLPELTDEEQQVEKWFRYYDRHAQSWSIRSDVEPRKLFKRSAKPILRYRNYHTLSHGGLYIWTSSGGRPEVISAIWSHIYSGAGIRAVRHEMQSLSLNAVSGQRNMRVVWAPSTAGVEPKVIPGAPAPGRSKDLRLIQMRELANDITAFRTERGKEERLRLVTLPLYRYDVGSADLLDGGLFIYFDEDFWDPEVVMILEARRHDGKFKWHVAGGRFTYNSARLEYEAKVVWESPRTSVAPTLPYYYFDAESRHSRHGPTPDQGDFNPLENLQLSEQRLLKFYGAAHPITQTIQRMLKNGEAELRARGEEIRKLKARKPDAGEPGPRNPDAPR